MSTGTAACARAGSGRDRGRHRVFGAVAELAGLLHVGLLVVGDVHWADETTLELLLYLASGPGIPGLARRAQHHPRRRHQTDIDAWLDHATQHRYLVRAFTHWALARRLAVGISVPAIPHTQPGHVPAKTPGGRCSAAASTTPLPLDVRAGGALLLLYGQFVTRVVRLTTADLRHDGNDTCLQAGAAHVLLPPTVAAAVCAQRDASPERINYRHSSQDARPLFPGCRYGQHLGAEALARRLRQHGIEPHQCRNQALVAGAAEVPAPVLADILGLHVTTAEQLAQRAR